MTETAANQPDDAKWEEAQAKLKQLRDEYKRRQTSEQFSGIPLPAQSSRSERLCAGGCGKKVSGLAHCRECYGRKINEIEQRDRREKIEKLFSRSGLPHDYRKGIRTWTQVAAEIGPDNACAVEILKQGKGLYIWGGAGPFKTSLAASYLAEMIRSGRSGRYVFVPDLFTELYEIYAAQDHRSRADVVERYALTDCLVLDDLGKERPSEHAASVLMQIFDIRYRENRRWMIVTSNWSLDGLGARLDAGAGTEFAAPIVRRISEMTVSVPMERRL